MTATIVIIQCKVRVGKVKEDQLQEGEVEADSFLTGLSQKSLRNSKGEKDLSLIGQCFRKFLCF